MAAIIRILIVDDQPLARRAMRRSVPWSRFDMEVSGEAANGNEALRFLRGHEVDVVFTDMKMPLSDGNDLILKARPSGKKVRFVVLSGYSDYSLVRRAFRLGAYDYMLKSDIDTPRMEDLLRRLRAEIRGAEDGPERMTARTGRDGEDPALRSAGDAPMRTEERKARMAAAMARLDFQALRTLASGLFEGLPRCGASKEEMRDAALDFHLRLAHGMYEADLLPPDMSDDPAAALREIRGMDHARDLQQWIEEGIRACERRFQERHGGSPLDAVQRYIERNLERPLDIADLSSRFGISRTRLHALFAKKGLGGPKRFLMDSRIRRAGQYLATTDLKVEEVSVLVGCGSVEHFSRAFKKRTGLSPSLYRSARTRGGTGGSHEDPAL